MSALKVPWPSNIEGLWRACELPRIQASDTGISTGFPVLDDLLAERGWPHAGLVELLCEGCGIGELRLLGPALSTLSSSEKRCIAWVNPPYLPYAPALQAAGIDPGRVLLVRAKNHGDALWAFEQTCKSGACCAVLGWLAEPKLRFTEIRRLQFAAKQGRTWANLFRPASVAREASAAELRLRLRPLPEDRLNVDIVKRRSGWPLSAIELPLGATLGTGLTQRRRRLREQLARWRHERFGHRAESPSTPNADAG